MRLSSRKGKKGAIFSAAPIRRVAKRCKTGGGRKEKGIMIFVAIAHSLFAFNIFAGFSFFSASATIVSGLT